MSPSTVTLQSTSWWLHLSRDRDQQVPYSVLSTVLGPSRTFIPLNPYHSSMRSIKPFPDEAMSFEGLDIMPNLTWQGWILRSGFSDTKTSVLSILSLCPGSSRASFPRDSARRLGVWQGNCAARFWAPWCQRSRCRAPGLQVRPLTPHLLLH